MEKIKSFIKWAFSPIGTAHMYRGVTVKNPFPNICIPIILPLMFISVLPLLILYAPFWIFFKLTEKKTTTPNASIEKVKAKIELNYRQTIWKALKFYGIFVLVIILLGLLFAFLAST